MIQGLFWIVPVTNRALKDVKKVKSYLQSKKGNAGSIDEMIGSLNAADLNRIENNMAFLANALELEITTKEWSFNTLPMLSDKQRLLANAADIVEESEPYFDGESLPSLPNDLIWYHEINKLEQALKNVYNTLFEPILTKDNEQFDLNSGDFLTVKKSIES